MSSKPKTKPPAFSLPFSARPWAPQNPSHRRQSRNRRRHAKRRSRLSTSKPNSTWTRI